MDAYFGGKPTSKREFEIVAQRNVLIKMNDGVEICVDIFRPQSEGKFPALVAMSAFNKDLQSQHIWPGASRSRRMSGVADASIEAGPIDFFVRRGYVYVVGAVRGTGKSGGAFTYFGPREAQDAAEVVEWSGRQKWCNGKVGMAGIGAFATHHAQVAVLAPPHLKCIAPVSAFWDVYNYFWYPGGILANGFLRWLISLNNLDVHTDEKVALKELGPKGYKEAIERLLADKDIAAEHQLVDALQNPDEPTNGTVIDVLLHPTWCKYWEDRAINDYGKIKVPAYIVSASHRPGIFYHWQELKSPKKLLNCPPAYTDRPFYQFAWELLRWYDQWLKGMDTGIMEEPNIRLFVQNEDEWINAPDFPIPTTKFIPFNLHENKCLIEIEPFPEAAALSFDDAPGNRGSLKYSTPGMVENMQVAGPIMLNLYASCRGTDMNFVVSLFESDLDGKETFLTHGLLKASHRKQDTKSSKYWVAYHTHTNPQKLKPGEIYQFSINLNPAAFLIKAGHCIVLKISGVDDAPGDLTQVKMNHLCIQTPNTITIYHNAQYPSHLLLPITKGNIIGTYTSGGEISLKNKEFMKLK
jgi:uncharacterized protein